MRQRQPSRLRGFARDMRKDPADTESGLWQALRGRRLGNLKFRRQVPLNGYILDFVCFEAGIIVELDGSQHLGRCPARGHACRTSSPKVGAGMAVCVGKPVRICHVARAIGVPKHLEPARNLSHIQPMSKTAKSSAGKTIRRSSQTGEFLGVTKDGIRIPRPPFKPVSFTERQLNKVMRELRELPSKAG